MKEKERKEKGKGRAGHCIFFTIKQALHSNSSTRETMDAVGQYYSREWKIHYYFNLISHKLLEHYNEGTAFHFKSLPGCY